MYSTTTSPAALVERVCESLVFSGGANWICESWRTDYYDIVTERRGAPVMLVDAERNVVWSAKVSPTSGEVTLPGD